MFSFLDVGLSIPFYFESFQYGSTLRRRTQEWYLGDMQMITKYRQIMPEKFSWMELGFGLTGNMSTAEQGKGLIPREIEFNPTGNSSGLDYSGSFSRVMGTNEFDLTIAMYASIDVKHWFEKIPVEYHFNFSNKKTAVFNERDDDFADVIMWSLAAVYTPFDIYFFLQ